MKVYKSYNTQIWVGLREAYTDKIHTIGDVEEIVDKFVNQVKDCVTITPTDFRYVDGHEPGVIVGWINYPRFPRDPSEITERALELGKTLMYKLGQLRVSITTPEDTYMIESVELGEPKYEEGETVIATWGYNNITKKPFEFLYDFGYYSINGCVVYNHGERNMQDSSAFEMYQIRRATSEDMKKYTWGR
jgi:hypothetical protein